jgi:hypothetical protein
MMASMLQLVLVTLLAQLFEQFPAGEIFKGAPARPVLKTAGQRQFRTVIREAAGKGANFAGHYTIAQWGCGAGCISIALIDAKKGTVYDGPFAVLGWGWPQFKYEGKYSANDEGFEPLSFRIDSRLLIVRGCPEDTDCGSYFYEWTGSSLKLIRKVPAGTQ